jgi:hypothetical protein
MFILRKVSRSGLKKNYELGSKYTYAPVAMKPESFAELIKDVDVPDHEGVTVIVLDENKKVHFVYHDESCCIINEHGDILEKL